MNRGIPNYNNCEERLPEKEECKCKPHPDHETETILKCGIVTGSAPLSCNFAVGDAIGVNGCGPHPTVLATVNLDTSKLINSTVKIDFSSLISFKTIGDDNYFLRLGFRLSKACDGNPVPLGIWTFEQVHHENELAPVQIGCEFVQETDSFCFSWCECEECPDCCRYLVEIVDLQCYNIDFATVCSISLTALAVGEKHPHY